MAEQIEARPFVIGVHVGVIGRIARLLLGGFSVVTGVAWLAHNVASWWVWSLAFAGAFAFYVGIYHLLMWRPVAREPWLGTFVVLAPLALLNLGAIPAGARFGVATYIGASLVVNAVVGYGGCEAVVAPSLLFRRRPTVYCPYNVIDAVERPLRERDGRGRVWVAASVLAVTVGAYFVFVGPLLRELGAANADFRPVSGLLLLPAVAFGWRAWRRYQQRRSLDTEVRTAGLGALASLAMAAVFFGGLPQDLTWATLMLAGLTFAVVRLIRRALHRHRATLERQN